MTGPEHYREAERLLAVAQEYRSDGAHVTAGARMGEAQAHALLALAAAMALQPYNDSHDWSQWRRVAGLRFGGGDD